MAKHSVKKAGIFSVLCFTIYLVALIFSANIATEAANPLSEAQEKMAAISDEEKEILQNLFDMTLELEEQEKEEASLEREIDAAAREINELTQEIKRIENNYVNRLEDLKAVLQIYQRNGPGNYLQIIMESDSLSTLLIRINLIRDLTHNTENILKDLKTSESKLSADKAKQVEMLSTAEKKRAQLRETINKKLLLKEEKEKYLLTLKEEKEHYQEYLANMQELWEELKPLFNDTSKEFSRILEAGYVTEDALNLSFTIFSIKAIMDEKTLNSLTLEYSNADLPRMIFNFYTDKVIIDVPERNLVLEGTFQLKNNHTIMFKPEKGSFYGIALKPNVIEELSAEGELVLDLKPILGNSTLKSIQVKDDQLELAITLIF